jgi:hypothetical protein
MDSTQEAQAVMAAMKLENADIGRCSQDRDIHSAPGRSQVFIYYYNHLQIYLAPCGFLSAQAELSSAWSP